MAEPSNLPVIANLPPLPEHQVEVWDRLCTRMSDCRTRHGIYLLLAGWTYREAARALKIGFAGLADSVSRYGLGDALHRSDRVASNHRAIAIATTEEMLERARDGNLKDESLRDLAVTAGISTDKVRDFERQQAVPADALTLLQQIGSGLAERGLRLDVTLRPAETDGVDVVDVVAVPSGRTSAEPAP